MIIDWFTVLAQTINFLILVWLMRRYLYRPILDAIDTRERQTAKLLADADAKESAARKSGELFKTKNDDFDRDVADRMKKATDDVAKERLHLLDEARKAADAQRAEQRDAARNELKALHQTIFLKAQQEVVAITRKTLTDLASSRLEDQLDAVFIRRLQQLDAGAKSAISTALRTSSGPALVRSAFALSDEQHARITQALNEAFSCACSLRFEVIPELVCGIEFLANGQKIAWNIADHLAALEQGLVDLANRPDRQTVPSGHQPVAKAAKAGIATAPNVPAEVSHQQ
jgi:F-type H+-transporting ATPase subunit b